MEVIDILTGIGGVMMATIGYFLRQTMGELKEVKSVAYKNLNEINVIKNENKHLINNIERLEEAVKELTTEIKNLNVRIK